MSDFLGGVSYFYPFIVVYEDVYIYTYKNYVYMFACLHYESNLYLVCQIKIHFVFSEIDQRLVHKGKFCIT